MRRLSLTGAVIALTLALTTAASAQTNDEYFGLQWGQQQINTPEAWTTSTGSGQTIAIVDTGVDLDHPDLDAKIARGATFTGCADDPNGCGNGDWESAPEAGPPSEHGTHVAGIAAAETGNGIGVAGTAPEANLLAVKVLTDDGGSFKEVAAGIRWSADNGADVINLSLGALPGVQALVITGLITEAQEAIAYARSKGVVVVAAAGNDFASICGTPAFDEGALCVASTDIREQRSTFSNFPIKQDLDAVSAPGGSAFLACSEDIISTVPPEGEDGFCEQRLGTPGYDFYAGTSMATPHVAGVAALLTAQGRDDDETVAVLKSTARTPPANTRGTYTPVYGYGIVDAQAATAAPVTTAQAKTTKKGAKKKKKTKRA
jgi:subtilisin family serine protease